MGCFCRPKVDFTACYILRTAGLTISRDIEVFLPRPIFFKHLSFRLPLISIDVLWPGQTNTPVLTKKSKTGQILGLWQKTRHFDFDLICCQKDGLLFQNKVTIFERKKRSEFIETLNTISMCLGFQCELHLNRSTRIHFIRKSVVCLFRKERFK